MNVVIPYLEVKMGACGMSGSPNGPYPPALSHRFSSPHQDAAEMGVVSPVAVAVIYYHELAIPLVVPSGKDDVSGIRCHDRSPRGRADVYGFVPAPEPLRYPAAGGPDESASSVGSVLRYFHIRDVNYLRTWRFLPTRDYQFLTGYEERVVWVQVVGLEGDDRFRFDFVLPGEFFDSVTFDNGVVDSGNWQDHQVFADAQEIRIPFEPFVGP